MEDTIVAISTALGVGAISIIRLSGKDAIEIVNNCFKGKDLTKVNSHTINYGFIKNNNEIVDEVLVSVMRAPKTFTTEDIVEINSETENSNSVELLIERIKKIQEELAAEQLDENEQAFTQAASEYMQQEK